MSNPNPNTSFEEAVKAQIRDVLTKSGQYSNITYREPDLGAWRHQLEVILAAHQAELDRKVLEVLRAAEKADEYMYREDNCGHESFIADRIAEIEARVGGGQDGN